MGARSWISNARQAWSRWSTAYPNGATAIYGLVLLVLPVFFELCRALGVSASHYVWKPVGSVIEAALSFIYLLLVFLSPALYVVGIIVILFAAFAACYGFWKNRTINRVEPYTPRDDDRPKTG